MNQTLKEKYQKVIRPELKEKLNFSSIEAVPKLTKITLNTSSSEFKNNKELLSKTKQWLSVITGQASMETRAKLSIASFDLREGDIVGLKTTLRGDLMYDFFQQLISTEFQRIFRRRRICLCMIIEFLPAINYEVKLMEIHRNI